LHLVGFLLTLNCDARNHELKRKEKDQVYVPPLPASIPELKVRIRTATETITADIVQTVWNKLDYRADVCRITKGAYIEHL